MSTESVYRYFEQLIDPLVPRSAERPPAGTGAFFWHFIGPVRGVVLATLLLTGIASLAELYIYIYLGDLIDWMGTTPRDQFLAVHAQALIGMLVVVAVIRPLALLGSRALINLALVPGLANMTRWQNHRYVLRQSMSFFQNDFAGRISQKVMQTGHSLREAVLNVIDGIWMLVIYLVGVVVLFADIDTVLLWPVAAWVLAYGAFIVLMVPPVRAKSAALSEANSGLIGRVVDSYTNIQSVKLFAHHRLEEDFAATGIRRHTTSFRVLMRAILGMTAALTLLNTALVVGMAGLSVWLWLQESITVGQIAVANGLIIRINHMSGWILRSITSLFEHIGTVQNGVETIALPTDIIDAENARELEVDRGVIRFDAVSFRYEREEAAAAAVSASASAATGEVASAAGAQAGLSGRNSEAAVRGVNSEHRPRPARLPVIDNATLEIAAGEKIGLVGRSGAGKSTLINLLMRFHEVQSGRILIDHQDIRGVFQESLRARIAVVTQDTSLLHRSIADNIRYGRPEASEEEVLDAARRAEALEFIDDLVDMQGRRGFDAQVGERGVKLSGGQRQRISIARVIVKNAPILVLDEATSALDSEVEAAIQGQLDNLMRGKTVLAVAHRLSTIAALDRLVVLDAGRIVETGTHADLLACDGLYSRLWHRQSGGFLGG